MSSEYNLICVSHDPAIVIGYDLTRSDVVDIKARDGRAFAGHEECDVLAGRWSGALVEVGCFGIQIPGPTGCKGVHRLMWADKDWLRLLHAATPQVPADVLSVSTFRCWTPDRLGRLRFELGLADLAEPVAVIDGKT